MMESVLRHRAALAAIASTLVLGVAVGCGSERPGEPASKDDQVQSDDKANQADKSGKSGEGDDKVLPEIDISAMPTVTLSRSGGLVGYMDTLVISADGVAKVTSRGKSPYSCTVEPTVLEGIARNSIDVPQPKLKGKKSGPVPDQITYTLSIDKLKVTKAEIESGDTRWEALFLASERVLGSAASLRDGTPQPKGGMACTK